MNAQMDSGQDCALGLLNKTKLDDMIEDVKDHKTSIKRAHERLDNTIQPKMFYTVVVVLVGVLVGSIAYQYNILFSLSSSLSNIDKNVAVLAERSEGLKSNQSALKSLVEQNKAWNASERRLLEKRLCGRVGDKNGDE